MSTVYIALNIESILLSIRDNVFVDAPTELRTEDGRFILTESGDGLAISALNYIVRTRDRTNLLDRSGSAISLRQ